MKIETTDKYIKVSAEDDFVLTYFKEGDDILNYTFAKVMYAPLNADLSELREITEEESERLLKEQEEKIKELNLV